MATEPTRTGAPENAGSLPPPSSYRALFANGDYLRLFSAGLASVAGSAIAVVSVTWIVAEATGSFLAVGLLGAS